MFDIRMQFLHTSAVFLLAAWLAAPGAAGAAETGRHQRVGGIDIYYGVLPGRIVGQRPDTHEEKSMHGGVPGGKDGYHLVVALFDANGKRIDDAQVWARVGEFGLAGTRKKLEPMPIGDTISFGNYFVLRGADLYRIAVEVRLPHAAKPVVAQFDYRLRSRP